MRARATCSLPIAFLPIAASVAWGVDRMVRLVPANGSTMFVKEFRVAAGTTITGVTFVSSDASTTFPEVSLARGPATSLASATTLRTATDVRPGSTNAAVTWSSPVTVSESGTYYVAIRLPAGQTNGPALAANEVTAPDGSYAVGSRDDTMIAVRVDLGVQLTTSGGPSKTEPGDESRVPDPEGSATENVLVVRASHDGSPVIAFALPRASMVTLAIYDVSGRLLRQLHHGMIERGDYEEKWDGRDDHGAHVAAGVYIVRLRAADADVTRKVTLTK